MLVCNKQGINRRHTNTKPFPGQHQKAPIVVYNQLEFM